MGEFGDKALQLCVKMRTRVPPFIISTDEEHFVPEVHDLKHVRGGPDPEECPKMSVNYLRPIVYYNYQKTLLIPGRVVGTLIPKKGEVPSTLADSTKYSKVLQVY